MNKNKVVDLNFYRKFFTFSKINYYDTDTKAFAPEECTPLFVFAVDEEKENFHNSTYEFAKMCARTFSEMLEDPIYRTELYSLGLEKAFQNIEKTFDDYCLILVGHFMQNQLVARMQPKVIVKGKDFVIQNAKMINEKLEQFFKEKKEEEEKEKDEV